MDYVRLKIHVPSSRQIVISIVILKYGRDSNAKINKSIRVIIDFSSNYRATLLVRKQFCASVKCWGKYK